MHGIILEIKAVNINTACPPLPKNNNKGKHLLLLTGFSLGCLALIFVIVARDFWQYPVAKAFLAMLLSGSAFLLSPQIDPRYEWLAGDIMTMLPAFFWLVCQLAFTRRPRLLSIWGALAVYSFVAPAITRSFGANIESAGAAYIVGWQIPQYCEYLVILNGLWAIVAHWKDDLVESRRKFRAALLLTLGVTGLWVTISLNTGNGTSSTLLAVVALCSLTVGALLLKGREGVLFGVLQNNEVLPPVIVNSETKQQCELKQSVAKLDKVMDDEKFYRTEKLTLSMLAEEIGLPEYKTRALINQTFNYRNFNDYVNQLRIEEASERLISEPDTPIQNIALDVGYRTLSSFNRAFKEISDQTPTAFRQSKTSS